MKYQIKVMHREMNWQCSANNNMFKMFQKLEHIVEAVHMLSFALHHSSLGHIENCMLRTYILKANKSADSAFQSQKNMQKKCVKAKCQ